MANREVKIGDFRIANRLPLALIAGPCVMESRSHLRRTAVALVKIARALKIHLVFKCSFDKANRSSSRSFRGFGMAEGLEMLAAIKREFGLPILTDVHLPHQAEPVAQVADILQIPAFLCRQTDLISACARTGKAVNVKKGQFLSPWEMENIIEKVLQEGNPNVLLTERGHTFGYQNLVADMRSLAVMKRFGAPVLFDATHSVQLPGGRGGSSGGEREFVEPLARASCAVGVAAVFMEVHPQPDRALSDGPNSVKLADLKGLLEKLIKIDRLVKNF